MNMSSSCSRFLLLLLLVVISWRRFWLISSLISSIGSFWTHTERFLSHFSCYEWTSETPLPIFMCVSIHQNWIRSDWSSIERLLQQLLTSECMAVPAGNYASPCRSPLKALISAADRLRLLFKSLTTSQNRFLLELLQHVHFTVASLHLTEK